MQTGLPESTVSQLHLNGAKNWVKHWPGMKADQTIPLELEAETIQYIVRAASNLSAHDRSLQSEGPRFFTWLRKCGLTGLFYRGNLERCRMGDFETARKCGISAICALTFLSS